MPAKLRRALPAIAFLAGVAVLFLIANRTAYRSYFADDELDNLVVAASLEPFDLIEGLLLPRFYTSNFRPTGYLYFYAMSRTARLEFPPYIAVLHILHLVNVALLWLVLRHLALPPLASATGVLVFAFHMATFDIYWMPMYVFDLLCGTFCLAAILFWLGDRWILSLIAFWLAYRAKEIAVMLPLVLAACEYFVGRRRWKLLIPFFALSLWLGVQALLTNRPATNDYSLRFRPADMWECAAFYASKLLLVPNAGWVLPCFLAAIIVLAVVLRDRRLWIGLIAFAVFLAPMLLLPGRLYSAYLYVPLIGLSIALAAIAARPRILIVVVVALACWLPWNYQQLRELRHGYLDHGFDRRQFVAAMSAIARDHPDVTSYVYHNERPLTDLGVRAAGRLLHPHADKVLAASEDSSSLPDVIRSPWLAYIYFDSTKHRAQTIIRTPQTPDVSYIKMGPVMPVWQLSGWYTSEATFRWSRPHATARFLRPSDATAFEMYINASDKYSASDIRSRVDLSLNGRKLGGQDITHSGWQTLRWIIPAEPTGPAEVTIDVSPPYPADVLLGVAVGAMGFR